MTKKTHTQFDIQKADKMVRAGDNAGAKEFILGLLAKAKNNRELSLSLAALARRIQLPMVALKLLRPYVRPSSRRVKKPTQHERIEYAGSLIAAGAHGEALGLLSSIPKKEFPKAGLFEAFASFSSWDYGRAIPLLQDYIDNPNLTDYERDIGKLNLAAALVTQWDFRAEGLLDELRESFTKKSMHRLLSNVLELSGQNAFFQKDYKTSAAFLNKAEECLKTFSGLESFFIKKWQTICLVQQKKAPLEELRLLRAQAQKLQHYESVRDCDLFIALLSGSKTLLNHVYFGTPFEGFRQRLYALVPGGFEPDSNYRLGETSQPSLSLVVASGKLENGREFLKAGQTPHRLLLTLLSDFYRPFRVATLHGLLYPGEYFNVESSPGRIHQLIKRLRDNFEKQHLELPCVTTESGYLLSDSAQMSFIISRGVKRQSTLELRMGRLRNNLGRRPFRVNQVASLLELSERSAQRLLKAAIENGEIQSEGSGSSTEYRFAA